VRCLRPGGGRESLTRPLLSEAAGADVSQYWGTGNNDTQILKNAGYVKERFLDKGLQGMLGGEGFYKYPNPAYAELDFLAVPDVSVVPTLVDRVMPRLGIRPAKALIERVREDTNAAGSGPEIS